MSSLSTAAPFGMWGKVEVATGGAPPMRDGCIQNGGDFVSMLSQIKAAGARCVLNPIGSSKLLTDSASKFSMLLFEGRMDLAAAQTNATQMANFVKDGTLIGLNVLDDFQAGSSKYPGGAPTLDQVEACAAYCKSKWPGVPVGVRGFNTYLEGRTDSYVSLDFGWTQWSARFGNPQTFFQNNVTAGKRKGLGHMCGINLLDGGSGLTAPWNQHPNLVESGSGSPRFGCSPMEIDQCAAAFMAIPDNIGFFSWKHTQADGTSTYYERSDIQAAYARLAAVARPRLMGPINSRGTSVDTSGTTVVGDWSLTGVGDEHFASSGNNVPLKLPSTAAIPVGALMLGFAYSRDNGRSPTAPSGWSEAARVSGTSAQGGEMALFYRIAQGGETQQDVSFSGTTSGYVKGTRMAVFTGNLEDQGTVLSGVGSDSSWAASSDLGPVKSATPTHSNCLCVVFAGKVNDFAQGDPPANTALSSITGDSTTWTRLWLADSTSESDIAYVADYAALSGVQSVSTKTWTSQATIASTGAGCGFIAFFRPASVATEAQDPPAIISEIENFSVLETSTTTLQMLANGTTPITWTLGSGAPSSASIVLSSGTFFLTNPSVGTSSITVVATNAHGTDSLNFFVTVLPLVAGSNTTPVITHPGDMTVRAEQLLSFGIASTDAEGDEVTFTLDEGTTPQGAVISDDGQFVWIPTGEQGPGVYPIIVTATDGIHESRSTFTITVADADWTRRVLPSGDSLRFGKTYEAPSTFSRIG